MSDIYAWYYKADNSVYYWTESFNMSATQFAKEVSVRVDKVLTAADIFAATKKKMDERKNLAKQLIYIP